MANRRCPDCKKFVPNEARKCPHCKADLRLAEMVDAALAPSEIGDAGFTVEPLPRYRFELRFPTGEKVELWVEGDEVEGVAAVLHTAADALVAQHRAVAP
jgi:glutaredoxin